MPADKYQLGAVYKSPIRWSLEKKVVQCSSEEVTVKNTDSTSPEDWMQEGLLARISNMCKDI